MFFVQCCILCMEMSNSNNNQNSITIDSDDQHSENARITIEQHFKEELLMLSSISNNSNKIVCGECWDLVQSFHEFYIKVKNAHLAASFKIQSLQEEEIAVAELKTEPHEVDKLTRLSSNLKTDAPLLDEDLSNLLQVSDNLDDSESVMLKSEDQSESSTTPCSSTTREMPKSLRTRGKCTKKPKIYTRLKSSSYDELIALNFKLICILCEISLKDFTELKMHFKRKHQANGYVKCCGRKFFNRSALVDHTNVHSNPEYFKCQQCGKAFSDRKGLETHLQNFHDSKERTIYRCEICSKSFFRKEVLDRHVLTHAPEEEKNVKCTQCDKRFCNQYGMKQHLALVHLNLYAKICDICGKALNGNEAFRRHQEDHAGVQRALIKCKLCNAQHKNKYLLTRHMKTMHTEEYQTPQVCPICSKTSPTLRAHKSHMEYMHTEKRHICKLCDKAFKVQRCLREHMTTHTGEVLYTCTFCPQTFNSISNMYAHRKRKHPKEWSEKYATKNNKSSGMRQLVKKDLISTRNHNLNGDN